MKLDYLFFAAHPDDVELCCAGTILIHTKLGKKIGIIDLTAGELGSRGNVAQRAKESEVASKLLGISARENMGLRDGFFTIDEHARLQVIRAIRTYQPTFVFANATDDRHPDHGRASRLVRESFFLSGLRKIETRDKHGQLQAEWRAKSLFYYIQDKWMMPDFVVDVSAVQEERTHVLLAYVSQFHNPNYEKREGDVESTYISTPAFLESWEARFRAMGQLIGTQFGEGFKSAKGIGLKNLDCLVASPF